MTIQQKTFATDSTDSNTMRIFNLIRFLAMACLLCFYSCLVLADTRYVVPAGTVGITSGIPYNAWTNAATNIQWAVNAAAGGETVRVTNGSYCLTNQVEVTNNITVQSVNGYSDTLVYADWPDWTTRCFYVASTGIVDGFSISNGHYIQASVANNGGGGAYVTSSGMIRNCYFVDNICSNGGNPSGGGGAFIYEGVISDCIFYNNTAYRYAGGSANVYGGGICVLRGGLFNCTVISNYLRNGRAAGGAAMLWSQSAITNCFFAHNGDFGIYSADPADNIIGCVISNNTSGISFENGNCRDSLIINNAWTGVKNLKGCNLTNCVIAGNSDGGIWTKSVIEGGEVRYMTADNCIISNNNINISYRTSGGAGIRVENAGVFRNCLICSNSLILNTGIEYGGGVFLTNATQYVITNGAPQATNTFGFFNCTIVDNYSTNEGGGICVKGPSNCIVNCVIANNRSSKTNHPNVYYWDNVDANKSNFYYCCAVTTNAYLFTANQGNITNDPLLVNPGAGNWRLSQNSPCINKGTNQSWMANFYDLDGGARIRYGRVDMGAYERIQDGTVYNFH